MTAANAESPFTKRNLLYWLAILSGVCGISYEVLYSRLLSTYLGDMFYVNASILSAFFISMAIGNLIAHRFVRLLPYIEIAIGVYAVVMASLFTTYIAELTPIFALVGGESIPLLQVSIVWGFLLIPAILIGFSVPLFTLYWKQFEPSDKIGWCIPPCVSGVQSRCGHMYIIN